MSRAEWWAWWSGWWAVGFTVLAALAGLIAWYWGNRAAAENDERTQAMELSISQQQERAAKAETELVELQQRLAPRHLSGSERSTLVEVLKTAFGTVHIQYLQTDNGEPRAFAHEIADS